MKPILNVAVLAVLLVVAPGRCLALWEIDQVTRERANELGMEVRSTRAGPNDVRMELEFKAEGLLKDFSHVDLRVGGGDVLVAPLKEDRSKPGRVVVSFAAARARIDTIALWVMVPGLDGGVAYEVRATDFVDLKNLR